MLWRSEKLSHPAFSKITGSSRVSELTEFLLSKRAIAGGIIGATRGASDSPVIAIVPRKGGIDFAVAWFPHQIDCYSVDLPGRGKGCVPTLGHRSWLISFQCFSRQQVSTHEFSSLTIQLKHASPVPNYKELERFDIREEQGICKIVSTVIMPFRYGADVDEDDGPIDLSNLNLPTS